jgi:hypothetical protein
LLKIHAETDAAITAQLKSELDARLGAVDAEQADEETKLAEKAALVNEYQAKITAATIKQLNDERAVKEAETKKSITDAATLAAALTSINDQYTAKIEQVKLESLNTVTKAQVAASEAAQKARDKELEDTKKFNQQQLDDITKTLDDKTQKAEAAYQAQYRLNAELDKQDEATTQAELLRHANKTKELAEQTAYLQDRINVFANAAKQAFLSLYSDGFQELGKAMVTQQNLWGEFGKAALKAIGNIIKGVGDQLMALAAADVVKALAALASVVGAAAAPGYFAAAGIEAAGGAAAYTAAGAVSAAYESGTESAKGGIALVGEAGPELVDLNPGARVLSNKDTMQAIGGGDTYQSVTFNSPKALNLNEASRQARQLMRQLAWKA